MECFKQRRVTTDRAKSGSGLAPNKNPNGIAFRSSRPEVFCKLDVLKKITKFTGKYFCWSLFLIKLQDLRPVILL